MRRVCRQLDTVTLQLDEVIARLEADIRNGTLATYRTGKAERAIESTNSERKRNHLFGKVAFCFYYEVM